MKHYILFLIMTVSSPCVFGQSNNNFDNFFAKFTNDCTFQSSHIVDSVTLIQYNEDETNYIEQIDTLELYKNFWQCVDFSMYENIKEDEFDRNAVIRSRINDTGLLLYFFFVFVEENWYLYQIVDYSM